MRRAGNLWCFFSCFQLLRKEGSNTAQLSLSKLKEFQPLFSDFQLFEASKPLCVKEGKEE